ncbi:MAG: glutathione S-transferase family protein [Gammaproteobacteria bacterium]|nr:glutathione S-transferase family protein [Gammaproteobacteria bacterium]
MLDLYHHSESVCAQKVRLVLAEKDIEWNSLYINLEKGEQRTAEFNKINPKGVVPVLRHKGRLITESTVICEYLEETFPETPLMPADNYLRARKRLWTKAVDEGLHFPSTFLISFIVAFRHMNLSHVRTPEQIEEHLNKVSNPKLRKMHEQVLTNGMQSPLFAEAIATFDTVLENMQQTLKEYRWLAGDEFSLADIALAPYVHRLHDLKMLMMCEKRPAILDWYARLKSRPSWQTAIIDWNDQKYLDGMHSYGEKSQQVIEKIWRNLDQT